MRSWTPKGLARKASAPKARALARSASRPLAVRTRTLGAGVRALRASEDLEPVHPGEHEVQDHEGVGPLGEAA